MAAIKAYRKDLVLAFQAINVIVSVTGMKDKDESLVSVCCGPLTASHVPTKITQKLHCVTCNSAVEYSDLRKAQEVGGAFKVVDQQEVATARDIVLGATKKMLQVDVRDAAEVSASMLQGDSVYLVMPQGVSQIGAYSLLLDTITRHDELAFLTQWTPAFKCSPFQLKAFNGALVMQQLCAPEQVRAVPDLGVLEAAPAHQSMIDALLPTLVKPFVAAEYANNYAEALAALLATKQAVEGVTPSAQPAGPKAPTVSGGVDLTAALNAMLGSVPIVEAPAKRTRKKVTV